MAPDRSRFPGATTASAVLILFLTTALYRSDAVSSSSLPEPAGQARAIVLQPAIGGRNRHTMFLPLSLSSSTSSRNSSAGGRRNSLRRLGESKSEHPNARMHLHDDLLLNGYYTTRLWIGTPPQIFALIVDTGSTVTYVPCSTCEHCGRHQDPKFQPELSTTYQPVKCNTDCTCDNNREQCVYERQYAEMSSSSGVLGEDIISFGNESELAPQCAVFGCENLETGDLYSQHADGIMGLGRGDLSIVDQLVDRGVISDSFSLCYGGMDIGGGAMVLGDIPYPSGMVFAKSDPVRSPYYNIALKELHVAGKKLPLNPRVFDGKHGTVLDSGTTYAYLPEAAFLAFKDAIMKELHSLKKIPGPDPNYNDICFSGAGSDILQMSKTFPVVDMVFDSGQKLSLSPENYLFRHSKVHGAYCLGIFKNGNDPTTLLGGGFQVGLITFYMLLSVKYTDLKPHMKELAHLIAQELDVNSSQVHLLNFTAKGNDSLTRWSVLPTGSADYFSNTTAMSIIERLAEHRVQLPENYGSYQLVEWNVEPPPIQSWWQQHYMVVVVAIVLALIVGLLVSGAWIFWRQRQPTLNSYKPVDAAVPEQELQPL